MGLEDRIWKYLEKEKKNYVLPFENNIEGLKEAIKPGDVLLVSGISRLSNIIKIVTKSHWSHSTLYIGEGKILEADNIIYTKNGLEKIERSVVIENPIEKYQKYNIRVKRPHQLTEEDLSIILNEAKKYLGKDYDRKNLYNFLLGFLGFKKFDYRKSMGSEGSYTCSALIANLFQSVKYPILPEVVIFEDGKRLVVNKNYTHISPGDFDLASSQFWQTISFQGIGKSSHYKDIPWYEE